MKMLAAIVLLFVSTCLSAAPGHWYDPSADGVGLQINQNKHGFGHAITWYLYREDGSTAFLIGNETCPSFPCVVELVEPTASYMGGSLEIGDPVGILEIGELNGEMLVVRYDLRAWQPERCSDISPGGVIFRKCAGTFNFVKLTD